MIRQKLRKFYKRHKKLSIALIVLIVFFAVVISIPLSAGISKGEVNSYDGANKYITFDERTLISAHRAGALVAPENTMRAFRESVTSSAYKVDILEFDLHITADGKLIVLHDDTVDRTSNAREYFGAKNIKASEKTYDELRGLNMGENFKDARGNYPYRGLRGSDIPDDLRVVLLDDVLDFLSPHSHLSFIIEIKDGGDQGRKAMDILYSKLAQFGILNRAIVGTFNQEISDYMDARYPSVIRSAGIKEVFEFYLCSVFNVDLSKKDIRYKVLQIPYDSFGLNFGKKSIIDYAHKYDLAVQYWTINKAKDIEYLVKIGADAIITDAPDVAYRIIYSR